jgi:uncharacterized protein
VQQMKKILAIDGGGIRGIIRAIILRSIEEQAQRPASHLFDLIAGTSTGGLLALGLTKPDTSMRTTPPCADTSKPGRSGPKRRTS